MIRVEGLSKSYHGIPVLENISIELKENHIYCLMGASGSGKTTLLHILMGLIPPDSGTITGRERHRMSAVFQEDRLLEAHTPVENLRLVVDKSVKNENIVEHLRKILPKDCLNQPVRELSGGMKRRVALCRAMITGADVIFMDEPFAGLDEETRDRVIAYLKEEGQGKLILIATHEPGDVEKLGGTLILH